MTTRGARTAARLVLAWTVALAMGSSSHVVEARFWPSQRRDVARELASQNVAKRLRAAELLLRLPAEKAKKLVRIALRDVDNEVRLVAARAAAVLRLERGGDEAMAWLQDQDPRLRLAATSLIRACPTPRSVRALTRALGDADSAVRQAVAAALGVSGGSDAVGPLLGRLDDRSERVRMAVIGALERLGDARAVLPLIGKLQDERATVRAATARALGRLGDRRATMSLVVALQNNRALVKLPILGALEALGDPDAAPAIEALVRRERRSRAPVLRKAALFALVACSGERSAETLLAELRAEPVAELAGSAVATAVEALKRLGKTGQDALERALAATASRADAARFALALARLTPAHAAPPIVAAARRGVLRPGRALDALVRVNDVRALPLVLEFIDHADETLRYRAVSVATILLKPSNGDGRAVDVVAARLRRVTLPLAERVALLQLLGRTGSDRAVPHLLKAAASSRRRLREAAIEALATAAKPSQACDQVLLKALVDRSAAVRTAAALGLAKVGRGQVAGELLRRLRFSADQDRDALSRAFSGAMSRCQDPAVVPRVIEALGSVTPGLRDALIEGLGRMPTQEAGRALAGLVGHALPQVRRKVAEGLGGHPAEQTALLKLAQDPSPAVAANALWSLGRGATASALPALIAALTHSNTAVVTNATRSLGHVARRTKRFSEVQKPLCQALLHDRAYVRVQALYALRQVGQSCSDRRVFRLLENDSHWRVRAAAARLLGWQLRHRASSMPQLRQALKACAASERDAEVASVCKAVARPIAATQVSPGKASNGGHDVLVYVVPSGKMYVQANAEFALALPDGSLRLGLADQRGALFERDVVPGTLRLAIPASLSP